jgi:Peptidase inhibitor family I36
MTIHTRTWRWAAAGIALALALAWAPVDAQATTLSRELRGVLQHAPPGAKVISPTRVQWPRQGVTLLLTHRKAGWEDCIGRWVCLFENGHGQGRMIFFAKPGKFKLKAWSMGPDPRHHKGVSSYWNRRGGRALLWGPNYRHNAAPGKHNLPSDINDRSSYIQLFPTDVA